MVLSKQIKNVKKSYRYDIVIIDEAQDMNELYFRLVRDRIRKKAKDEQMVVIGDPKQSIF